MNSSARVRRGATAAKGTVRTHVKTVIPWGVDHSRRGIALAFRDRSRIDPVPIFPECEGGICAYVRVRLRLRTRAVSVIAIDTLWTLRVVEPAWKMLHVVWGKGWHRPWPYVLNTARVPSQTLNCAARSPLCRAALEIGTRRPVVFESRTLHRLVVRLAPLLAAVASESR